MHHRKTYPLGISQRDHPTEPRHLLRQPRRLLPKSALGRAAFGLCRARRGSSANPPPATTEPSAASATPAPALSVTSPSSFRCASMP